jgi:large subunit ribosomal protein L20
MRLAKGFFGRRKNCFSLAIRAVEKGLQKAYIGRKLKKRVVRREWIAQISAGAREHNISYAKLIFGMRYAEIGVNRKILSTLAQQVPPSRRLYRPRLCPYSFPTRSLLIPYSFPTYRRSPTRSARSVRRRSSASRRRWRPTLATPRLRARRSTHRGSSPSPKCAP